MRYGLLGREDAVNLETLVALAIDHDASDLHLEAGQALTLRVRGQLKRLGEPLAGADLLAMARAVLGEARWPLFVERQSFDFARTIGGRRCRIHVLQTFRGVGFAIRLLSAFTNTLESCNLHPALRSLLNHEAGLVLVCGPTGSGKSTTLAAFVHEINVTRARHIILLEHPVEYVIPPVRSLIRQREIEADTPSFRQALVDAMREDPEVLVVGEMRTAETMQLTLNAAETGHLVFATLHSSSVTDALARVAASFAPEIQGSVMARLADCLVAVIAQRLVWLDAHRLRVPVLEILRSTTATRGILRANELSRLSTVLQTGSSEGMWTFERYREWVDARSGWVRATPAPPAVGDPDEARVAAPEASIGRRVARRGAEEASPPPVESLDGPDEDSPGTGSEIDQLIARIEGRAP